MDDLSMFAAGEFRHRHSSGQHVLRAGDRARLSRSRPRHARAAASTSASTSRPRACKPTFGAWPRGYELIEPYYRSGPLPPVVGSPHREEGTLEYLHRWEELLGLMCRAGFVDRRPGRAAARQARRRVRQLCPPQPVRGSVRADQGPAQWRRVCARAANHCGRREEALTTLPASSA